MRKKLKSLEYNSIEEMETDFCLMIKNCLRYNSKETVYHKVASKMFDKGFLIINEVASAMEESLKLTPNDQNVKEKKYKIRSKRSLNYSEEDEISETEEEEDDINVHKNKLKIMDGHIEPNLKNKISEKEEIVIDERKLTEKVTNKDSIKNSELQRKLTRKVKREEILQKKLARKITREEVLPVSKTHDSEDNLSARESKKGKSERDSLVKKSKIDTEAMNKKQIIKSIIKKHKIQDSEIATKGNTVKHKSEDISPVSKKHKIEDSDSEGASPVKAKKVHFKLSKKLKGKKNKKLKINESSKKLKSNVSNKKLKNNQSSKKLKTIEPKKKAASTASLQDALSNTIEEKALEMLKNVLSKFAESGENETKPAAKKRSSLKKKKKITEENFLSNLMKNLNNKM